MESISFENFRGEERDTIYQMPALSNTVEPEEVQEETKVELEDN